MGHVTQPADRTPRSATNAMDPRPFSDGQAAARVPGQPSAVLHDARSAPDLRPSVGEDVAVVDMGDRYIVVKTDPITLLRPDRLVCGHVNANDIAPAERAPCGCSTRCCCRSATPPPRWCGRSLANSTMPACRWALRWWGPHGGDLGLDRPVVVGVLIGEVAHDKLITTGGAQVGDSIILVKGSPSRQRPS